MKVIKSVGLEWSQTKGGSVKQWTRSWIPNNSHLQQISFIVRKKNAAYNGYN